jgi:hypothetical protein
MKMKYFAILLSLTFSLIGQAASEDVQSYRADTELGSVFVQTKDLPGDHEGVRRYMSISYRCAGQKKTHTYPMIAICDFRVCDKTIRENQTPAEKVQADKDCRALEQKHQLEVNFDAKEQAKVVTLHYSTVISSGPELPCDGHVAQDVKLKDVCPK